MPIFPLFELRTAKTAHGIALGRFPDRDHKTMRQNHFFNPFYVRGDKVHCASPFSIHIRILTIYPDAQFDCAGGDFP
jgi:hypothetical protein